VYIDSEIWYIFFSYCKWMMYILIFIRFGRGLFNLTSSLYYEYIGDDVWCGLRYSIILIIIIWCTIGLLFISSLSFRMICFDIPSANVEKLPFEERYQLALVNIYPNHPFFVSNFRNIYFIVYYHFEKTKDSCTKGVVQRQWSSYYFNTGHFRKWW
jgi:hypothetical protein